MALNEWDKTILDKKEQQKIIDITAQWQKAYDAGDTTKADYYHAQAEKVRDEHDYSGGLWGNKPTAKKTSKVYTSSGLPVGSPVDDIADATSENPIVPFPMDANTSRIVKIVAAVFGVGLVASMLHK